MDIYDKIMTPSKSEIARLKCLDIYSNNNLVELNQNSILYN